MEEQLFCNNFVKNAFEHEDAIVLIGLYDINLKLDKLFNRIWCSDNAERKRFYWKEKLRESAQDDFTRK